jgi:hypothetical protein
MELTLGSVLAGVVSIVSSLLFFFYSARKSYLESRKAAIEAERAMLRREIDAGFKAHKGSLDEKDFEKSQAEMDKLKMRIDELRQVTLEELQGPSTARKVITYVAPITAIVGLVAFLVLQYIA